MEGEGWRFQLTPILAHLPLRPHICSWSPGREVRGLCSLPEGLGVTGKDRDGGGDVWVYESRVYTEPRT